MENVLSSIGERAVEQIGVDKEDQLIDPKNVKKLQDHVSDLLDNENISCSDEIDRVDLDDSGMIEKKSNLNGD